MKGTKAYFYVGALFVALVGTLFHFVYAWSGNNFFVGLVAPVNESVWEHTKLLFFPMLFYALLRSKSRRVPAAAMICGELCGVLSMIVLFYTYSGIIGRDVDAVNIALFYLCVALAFFAAFKASKVCIPKKTAAILEAAQAVLIVLYFVFTYFPPRIALFAPPV